MAKIFLQLCEEIDPKLISNLDDYNFKSVGISKPKVKYIRDLTENVLEKRIELDKLDELSDSEIIDQLTKIKGIGKWTAEMFLIFSLGRFDILSLGDIGLKRAARWLYQDDSILLTSLSGKWSSSHLYYLDLVMS